MTEDRIKVIALCNEELKNPGLPYTARENILKFLGNQKAYESYRQFFKEVTNATFDELANL